MQRYESLVHIVQCCRSITKQQMFKDVRNHLKHYYEQTLYLSTNPNDTYQTDQKKHYNEKDKFITAIIRSIHDHFYIMYKRRNKRP